MAVSVIVTNAWSVTGEMVRLRPIVRLIPAVFVLAGIVALNPVPPAVDPAPVWAYSHCPLLSPGAYDTVSVIGIEPAVLVRLRIWVSLQVELLIWIVLLA